MVQLKCQRCGRSWNFLGGGLWFTSCPSCKTSVKIKRSKEQIAELKKVIGKTLEKGSAGESERG